jgi:hypothetical protein
MVSGQNCAYARLHALESHDLYKSKESGALEHTHHNVVWYAPCRQLRSELPRHAARKSVESARDGQVHPAHQQ